MPFKKLSKDENHCRLASQELVDHFNRVNKLLEQAAAMHALSESTDFKRLQKKLETIRMQLERNHYRIGFIGPSQVGKSTSFNNVLGINKGSLSAEEYDARVPAKEGIGDAMTASITRLHAGHENKCIVEYLSDEMHKSRCDEMDCPKNR